MIPLALKIKKESHKSIAAAQDMIIQEAYSVFDYALFHGGTAIWRCYKALRFSEDIDMYLRKDEEKIRQFFSNLEKKGFIIEKKKITQNSIYSNLRFNRTLVRFEALFLKKEGVLKEYETIDGNILTVYTLTPEEFIKEKVKAYLKRLKIRDLYDIFFLMRYVENRVLVSEAIKELIKKYVPPSDETDLKALILEGIVPKSEQMISYLRDIRWENKNT